MDSASPFSSPPTPPSPLPISVGPGYQKYQFSPSPSQSPPFSPSSNKSSTETIPLLSGGLLDRRREPSAFSLAKLPDEHWQQPNWSINGFLSWLLLRFCCCCCSSNN